MAQPSDFIDLAERLLVGTVEIEYRAAANRAYYGAYHALLTVVSELPEEDRPLIAGRVGHREVARRLEAWQTSHSHLIPLKHAALVTTRNLRAMIAARERADYRIYDDFTEEVAETQVRRAKEVMRFVERVHIAKVKTG